MSIETQRDLIGMSRAGRVVGITLRDVRNRVRPGITTGELDRVAAEIFRRYGSFSAPQRIYGAPSTIFVSVNGEAVHGLPGRRVIRAGDVVKIDVTAELDGYIADAAITVAVPPVTPTVRTLCACVRTALRRAMDVARVGQPVNAIGRVVEREARRQRCAVLRELTAHGVGRSIHEPPTIPNYYDRRFDERLTEGLVVTLEPVLSAGSPWSRTSGDGWTICTADGSIAAHVEHTIVITRGRPLVLTAV